MQETAPSSPMPIPDQRRRIPHAVQLFLHRHITPVPIAKGLCIPVFQRENFPVLCKMRAPIPQRYASPYTHVAAGILVW